MTRSALGLTHTLLLLQYLGSFLVLCYGSDILLGVFNYFKLARKKEKKQISIFKL